MASRFVPVKSFEEAERLFEAGLLLVDNFDESQPERYRKTFVNVSDTADDDYIHREWKKHFGNIWPMHDFGVFVEED